MWNANGIFKWKIWHCHWFTLVGYILHIQSQNKISLTCASYLKVNTEITTKAQDYLSQQCIPANICPSSKTHIFFFYHGATALAGQALLIIKDSWSHSDTSHSVGLLWKSGQSDAETSTWQHTTLPTDRHPCPPAEFEPTISAGEQPKTYALDRAATGIGPKYQ